MSQQEKRKHERRAADRSLHHSLEHQERIQAMRHDLAASLRRIVMLATERPHDPALIDEIRAIAEDALEDDTSGRMADSLQAYRDRQDDLGS